MTTRSKTLLPLLAALLLAPGAPRAREGFKVVAHPSVKETTLTREALSRIFLKKTTRWDAGDEIRPVEQATLRSSFADQVHAMSGGALRSYWTQMIFSGRDVPPVERGTDEQILAYVREHRGSIGYVSAEADLSGVKVLEVKPPAGDRG
jgi:ABC-type phosphate transport system substrate-binding protein